MSVLFNNNNKSKEKVGKKLSVGTELNEPLADELDELNLQLTEFQAKFSVFCENTRECMDLDVLKDGVTFDVLGPLRPYYMRLNEFISRIVNLNENWEKDKQNNVYSVIQGLTQGKKICSYIEDVVKCARTNMKEISSDNKCVSVLQILGSTFNQLLEVVRCTTYKQALLTLQDYIINLFDAVKSIVTEPLDNSVVSKVDDLLASCLSQNNNTRLKQSTAALWKSAFSSAKDLKYSDILRKALTATSKKYPIGGFGDGTELLQGSVQSKEMKAPSTPKMKTPNAASKKRVMALIEDDSVDYVPIVSTSAKKMKLTEHQKDLFRSPREQLPYMDEDSVQLKGNVLSNIKSQFDVENSIDTLSSSISRSTNANIQSSAQLAESSQNTDASASVIDKDSTDKGDMPIICNGSDTLACEKDGAVVQTGMNVADIDSEAKQANISKKKRSVAVKLDFTSANETNVTENDDEISLAELRNRKKNDHSNNDVNEEEVILLSSSSSSSYSCIQILDPNEEVDMNKDSIYIQSVKSRRSLAKKTVPKKYKPPTKAVTETESKGMNPHLEKKRGRPKKSDLVDKEQSSKTLTSKKEKEDDDCSLLSSVDSEADKTKVLTAENNVPVKPQISDETNEADDEESRTAALPDATRKSTSPGFERPIEEAKSPGRRRVKRRKSNKSVAGTSVELSVVQNDISTESDSTDGSHPVQSLITEMLSPEIATKHTSREKIVNGVSSKFFSNESGTPEKVYSPDDLTTPEKSVNGSLITTPRTSLGVCHTPGILKKFDTPSASERKRMRVHFRNIDSESSLDGMIATNSTNLENNPVTGCVSPSELRLPIFKDLSECNVTISKILHKLLPPNQAGANFVRNVLERKKITTIGHLAVLDSQSISSLPFRKPRFGTLYAALSEYHKSISVAVNTTETTESVVPISQEVNISVADSTANVSSSIVEVVNGAVDEKAPAVEIENTVSNSLGESANNVHSNDIEMMPVKASEDQEIVQSTQELPSTLIAEVKAHSLCREIRSINEKLLELSANLPSPLEINQLKEVLLNVTDTMMSLGSLQQKLMNQLQ